VSEFEREVSIKRRPWLIRDFSYACRDICLYTM